MRVVHWFPNYRAGGGVANSVQALAEAQADAGADVWIASRVQTDAIYGSNDPGAGVRLTTWSGRWSIRVGLLSIDAMTVGERRHLRTLDPDVVHIHAEFNPNNWWVPLTWRCPLVLSPHGAFHQTVLRRRSRAKQLYRYVAERALWNRIDAFHALNPAEQSDIRGALPRANAYCIAQGPSPAVTASYSSAISGAKPPADEHMTLMFVGRLDVHVKGLDILIEAFARAVALLGPKRRLRLALIGPAEVEARQALTALARRHEVEGLVVLGGRLDAAEVPATLAGCDVYVQLSRNEGSPLSLNDALVLGKPAIVSDRVGTVSSPEIASLPHVRITSPLVEEASAAIVEVGENLAFFKSAAVRSTAELRRLLSWSYAAREHLSRYERFQVDATR
jgi:glycosyltransferase involved in cell wall biosynthesis